MRFYILKEEAAGHERTLNLSGFIRAKEEDKDYARYITLSSQATRRPNARDSIASFLPGWAARLLTLMYGVQRSQGQVKARGNR